jgi:gliding motility-associated-like protein
MVSYEWFMSVDAFVFESLINNPSFTGANTESLDFFNNTNYHENIFRVNMIDECGNEFSENFTLSVFLPEEIDNRLEDVVLCDHEIEYITVNYNGTNYVWSNGQIGSTFVPESSGTYYVTFTQLSTGCILTDSVNVLIDECIERCAVNLPTAFSPNNDGKNDIYRIITDCGEGFSYFEFRIYNRWGELVYLTNKHREGWDGNYKGRTAEIGAYTYYLEYVKEFTNEKKSMKGNVTLIR